MDRVFKPISEKYVFEKVALKKRSEFAMDLSKGNLAMSGGWNLVGILQNFVAQGEVVEPHPRVKGSRWRIISKEVTSPDPRLEKILQLRPGQSPAGGWVY